MEYNEFSETLKRKQIVFEQKRNPFNDKTNNRQAHKKIYPFDNCHLDSNDTILLKSLTMYNETNTKNNNCKKALEESTMNRMDSLKSNKIEINKSNTKVCMNLKKTGKENFSIRNSDCNQKKKKLMMKTPTKKLCDGDILQLLQCDVVQPTPPQILNKKVLQKQSLRKCLLDRNVKNTNFPGNSIEDDKVKTEGKTNTMKKVCNAEEVNLMNINESSVNVHDKLESTQVNKPLETSQINLRQKKRVNYAAMVQNKSVSISPKNTYVNTNLKVNLHKLTENIVQNLNISNKSEVLENICKKIPVYKSLHQNNLLNSDEINSAEIYDFEYDLNEDHKIKRKKRRLQKHNKNNKSKLVNIFFSTKSGKIKTIISNTNKSKTNKLKVCSNIPEKTTSTLYIPDKNIQETIQTIEKNVNNVPENHIENDNDMIESSEILFTEFNSGNQTIDQTILNDFEEENEPAISNLSVNSNAGNSPWRLNGPIIKSSVLFETNKSMLPRFNQDLLITEITNKVCKSPNKIILREHQNNSLGKISTKKNQIESIETESRQIKENSEITPKKMNQENISVDVSLIQSTKRKIRQLTIPSFMNSTMNKSSIGNDSITINDTPLSLSRLNVIDSKNESTPSENRPPDHQDFPFTPIRRNERPIRRPLQILNENKSKNDNLVDESIVDKNSSEDSLFGFSSFTDESLYKTRYKKNKKNITGPTRVSIGCIQKILNKNHKIGKENIEIDTVTESVGTTEIVANESILNTKQIQNTELVENPIDKPKDVNWINSSSDDDESINKNCAEDKIEVPGVGLFEENNFLITRCEAPRRSYAGRVKRKRRVLNESEHSENDGDNETSPFSHKKKKKKNSRTKKEEQEAARWAQQFNSMCAEVEQFELMVE